VRRMQRGRGLLHGAGLPKRGLFHTRPVTRERIGSIRVANACRVSEARLGRA
jgi:hypothetical protein